MNSWAVKTKDIVDSMVNGNVKYIKYIYLQYNLLFNKYVKIVYKYIHIVLFHNIS